MIDDIKLLFSTNEDFHAYVIKYCRSSGDSIEQALRKKIIRDIAKEYEPGGCNFSKKN